MAAMIAQMSRKGAGAGLVVVLLLQAGVARAAVEDGPKLLIEAVRRGDVMAVRALLTGGVGASEGMGDGSTGLHWAAHRMDLAMTELLLQAHANVNAITTVGITPLWLASTNGQLEIVTRLLRAGADPNLSPRTGGTPLMRAARGGHVDVVRALVAQGADVNATEAGQQQTALMWAASRRHPAVVEALLEAGGDPHQQTRRWREVVQLCCWAQTSDFRDGFTEVDRGGFTALHFAARQGDTESARVLLEGGARIEATAADGAAPLAVAAFSDQPAVVRFLLERGADPDAMGAGYGALHAAVLRGNAEAVEALLNRGANPNVRLLRPTPHTRGLQEYQFHKEWLGATPFWLAAAFLEDGLMQRLLAAGADPMLAAEDGSTPLIAVASQFLRRAGQYEGSIILPTPDEQRRALEIVTLLVEQLGAAVNAVNQRGNTAIHKAADRRMPVVVKFLGDRGGRVDIKNARGQTPIMLVNSCPRCEVGSFDHAAALADAAIGREEMLAVLQELGAKE